MTIVSQHIHGASDADVSPILFGTVDFLASKFPSSVICKQIMALKKSNGEKHPLVKAIDRFILMEHSDYFFRLMITYSVQ